MLLNRDREREREKKTEGERKSGAIEMATFECEAGAETGADIGSR